MHATCTVRSGTEHIHNSAWTKRINFEEYVLQNETLRSVTAHSSKFVKIRNREDGKRGIKPE